MSAPSPPEITALLIDWSKGDQAAFDQLLPLVYDELHRQARKYMRRERAEHTLQTTALINEAYLRLVDQREVRWQNRAHFFAMAAKIMRHILVDYARNHTRAKRGKDLQMVSFDEEALLLEGRAIDLLSLNDALERLAAIDPRKSQVVELRFFGGLKVEETVEVLAISRRTVEREWQLAKAWLRREIGNER